MQVGDKVQKVKGYRWPGIIASIFPVPCGPDTGKLRAVVCCTAEAVAGALHIYALDQLELVKQ